MIARCDVMRAMLNGDFREAHTNVVSKIFEGNYGVLADRLLYVLVRFRSYSRALRNTHFTNFCATCIQMKYLKYQPTNV